MDIFHGVFVSVISTWPVLYIHSSMFKLILKMEESFISPHKFFVRGFIDNMVKKT